MKIQRLLERAEAFLNADERRRKEKRKYLKQVINKLKKHEKKLISQRESESDQATRDKLKREITLAHAHRKKGLKLLKQLKRAKKSS